LRVWERQLLRVFLFSLFLCFTTSVFAQAQKSVNCFHDIAMLTRIAKSSAEKEITPIHDFYFFESPRFVNRELQVAVSGNQDQILHLFHEFDNTLFSDSYAAFAGIGVVNVRLMQLSNPGQFEFEQKSFALAMANGFKVPLLFQSFENGHHLVNVYQYMRP
jgi:hypothetical protein